MSNAVPRRPVILVVEDEFLVRISTVEMIEDAGFRVLQAADADEAIEILQVRPDIRVIFTDIHMPGSMDGLRLAHAVRARWPPIKNHCDFRTRQRPDKRFARRRAFHTKAVPPEGNRPDPS